MASDLKTKASYNSIIVDLEKLYNTNAECKHCISVLGTESDTLSFRQLMTLQIRDATSLCRSIKSKFNEVTCAPHLDTRTLQQKFILLHTELKDSVNQIKIKTKQYQAHNTANEQIHNIINNHKDKQHALSCNNLEQDEFEHHELQQDMSDIHMLKDADSKCVVNHKQILKEGWLYKKSRHLKKWRKRWIVVDKNTEDITLFTFKQQTQYKYPTERVRINDEIEIHAKEATENDFFVYHKVTKRKFKFRASDNKDRSEWIAMLQNEKDHIDDLEISDIKMNQNISESTEDNNMAPDLEEIYVDDHKEEDLLSNHDSDHLKNDREEKEELISNNDSLQDSSCVLYDKTNKDVEDCLILIDDLTYLRYEEDEDSENNRIISQFEHSLKESGFVTKDQMDQVRDVAIKLIGYMLDRKDTV